jgi:hypothetical protein
MKKKILLCASLFLCIMSFAQNTNVKIHIETENVRCDKILKKIQIYKYNSANNELIKTLTTDSCTFQIYIPQVNGKYKLLITAIDFTANSLDFEITNEQIIDLPIIIFNKKDKSILLNEITVVGNKREFIKIEADKTTYIVKGNPALSGGSMSDAMSKLPGVIKMPSRDFTFNGKNVTVYIDGVPSNLSGDDLKNYLQGIPANTIDKIEIIENPGASFESSTTGGVINIFTKSAVLNQFNSTINLHYGTFKSKNKYSPSIFCLGKINRKINWQLQTGYNAHEVLGVTNTNSTFTSFNPNIELERNNISNRSNNNFYLRPMLNFRLSSYSNLIFNYNLNIASNFNNDTTLYISNNYIPNINNYSYYKNINNNSNHEFVGKFKTQLDSIGKKNLQITAYYSIYNKNTEGSSLQPSLSIYGINSINLNLNNYYFKYDLDLDFNFLQVNTGGKFSGINANNTGKYNLNNSDISIINTKIYDTNQENYFNYFENNLAFYIEAKKKIGKFYTTVGLRFESLVYNGNTIISNNTNQYGDTLINLFPSINLMYELNNNFNIRAQYNKKISSPSYNSIDPNNNGYFDSYTNSIGNQLLKPNYYDNYNIGFTLYSMVNFSLGYSKTKNITFYTEVAELNTIKTNYTYKNYDEYSNYNISLSFPFPLNIFNEGLKIYKQPMNIFNKNYLFFYVGYNYQYINDFQYSNGKNILPFWQFFVSCHFNLPIDLKLDGRYTMIPQGNTQTFFITKPYHFFLIDLSKSFFKEKNLTLTAEVMKNYPFNLSTNSNNLNVNYYNSNDDLTFWFKLSYRFGKFQSKSQTQIETEQKQIESSGLGL